MIINKYDEYKKQYEKDQQTIKYFDELYRKPLQHNIIDKMNIKVYVIFLLNIWMKRKMNLFHKHEYKNKIELF